MKLTPHPTQSFHVGKLPVLAALEADAPTLEWIHFIKFGSLLRQADYKTLLRITEYWGAGLSEDFDAIACVPSHPLRSLLQVDLAFEWARCVSSFTERPLLKPGLSHSSILRSLLRGPQKELSQSERRANFESPKRIARFKNTAHRGMRVLLVDDVLNTGCSLLEAEEALLKSGHHVVGAFVLACTRASRS